MRWGWALIWVWSGGGGGGRLFEVGRLITFSALRMGAYSRWAQIRGWALIRINTVRTVSLFFCSPWSKTRDTQMATRVTDGARRERLPRAYIALTKSEGKERLLAVYLQRRATKFILENWWWLWHSYGKNVACYPYRTDVFCFMLFLYIKFLMGLLI